MDNIRQNGTVSSNHSVKSQLLKMKKEDWIGLTLLVLSFIPGKILKAINRNIWVVSEYENLARDNGYWFFKYLRENHKEVKVYYPLKHSSPDYEHIVSYGNVIEFGSFFHYMLFWAANIYIGTTKCYGFPYRRICEDLAQWNLAGFKYVFLNHGFTRGYSAIVDARETNYSFLITCADLDSKIIIDENYQPSIKVKCLGYARHDSLEDKSRDSKQILIMPTWRNWLGNQLIISQEEELASKAHFMESDYYKAFSSLLSNNRLIDFLESNNYTLVFYLHEYAQRFSDVFIPKSESIIIGTNTRYNIQDLLKQSSILITDYSSVSYDFAYMYKPVLYYQFDKDAFDKYQYNEGQWFNYHDNGFGEVIYDENILVEFVAKYSNNKWTMPQKYKERVDSFFNYHDHKNCQRIFDEIEKII